MLLMLEDGVVVNEDYVTFIRRMWIRKPREGETDTRPSPFKTEVGVRHQKIGKSDPHPQDMTIYLKTEFNDVVENIRRQLKSGRF